RHIGIWSHDRLLHSSFISLPCLRAQRAWFETRSLPTLTRSYPRRFTFYVALPDRSIVVVTDRRRRRCRVLSRAAWLRPHRALPGSIEIVPAARAKGATIPGLRQCCME